MALNASALGNMIVSNLQEAELAAEDTAMLSKWAKAIAEAIIDHIKNDAVVTSSGIAVNGGMSGLTPYQGPVINATGTLTDGKIA
jgi:hypothetical protein